MHIRPAILFVLLFALLLPVPAHAMTAAELSSRVQECYDKTRDLRADFTQVSTVKAMRMKKEGKGTLIIKKPGLLRYTYTKPEKQELIVRGEDMLMYTPSSNQAVKKTLSRTVMDKTPTTFLAGLGRITDSFSVRIPAAGGHDRDGHLLLELLPKGEKMGVADVVLGLDPVTYGIVSFTFTDTSGNTNAITLKNVKINGGVEDRSFNLALPRGTNVTAE